MVLEKKFDYGFNGYEVPHIPRAARSSRKSTFKKKSENIQISSFDLLAAVAGKLLLEGIGNNSSSSSNNASGDIGDQCVAVKKESVCCGVDQTAGEESHCGDPLDDKRRFFVSEILPKSQSFNRSPSPVKDSHLGSVSGLTSDSSEKFGTQELAYEESKIDNGDCYNSEANNNLGDVIAKGKENDDGENFFGHYIAKSFRSTLRIGDRRIRKVMASKYSKVFPKAKDTTVTNSDLDLKPNYYSKNYPIKKRRYFEGYAVSQCEETVKNENLPGSPRKVKLGIKSFRVPELFIEIPETATVGSLKRTVLEAVTTILRGGLHIGVLVHGEKVRDDTKRLLQTGISLDTLSDTLGFCLETNPEDSDFVRPCNIPHTLTRRLPSPIRPAKPSNFVENDFDSKPVNSRALIPLSPLPSQALTIVPPRKPKRSEVAQRRIRRPFSVSEVEALVQAVERLGTGRWRDLKFRAFDNAKHRTYVDLKDKWKTLVHTARISPQQRRGEPVPQELLDRVLTAHAYWSQQQGKHLMLEGEIPERLETSLGL